MTYSGDNYPGHQPDYKINIHDPNGYSGFPSIGLAVDVPKLSEWTMHIGDLTIQGRKGTEPNAFHRSMQRLILGIRWERASTRKE